jgi:hypothetical protein
MMSKTTIFTFGYYGWGNATPQLVDAVDAVETSRGFEPPIFEVVEWPGGDPRQIDLDVTPQVFAAVRKGRMTVPLGATTDLAHLAGLPWGSIATVHSGHEQLNRLVGPAMWLTDKWSLPVFPTDADVLAEFQTKAATLRRSLGLEPASV